MQEPIGLLISAVRRRIKQAVWARVEPFGTTPQQFWVLVGLLEHPNLSLSELAKRIRSDEPTASRLVRSLMLRGYVRDERLPDDRRRARYVLTPSGKKLARELSPVALEVRGVVDSAITQEEQEMVRGVLKKILARLDEFTKVLPASAERPTRRSKAS